MSWTLGVRVLATLAGLSIVAFVLLTRGKTLEVDFDSGRRRRATEVGPFRFDETIEETAFSAIPIGPGKHELTGKPNWCMMSKTTSLAFYDYVGGHVASDMSTLSILALVDAKAASAAKATYLKILATKGREQAGAYARAQEKVIQSKLH